MPKRNSTYCQLKSTWQIANQIGKSKVFGMMGRNEKRPERGVFA
jgi:hypothetical protein